MIYKKSSDLSEDFLYVMLRDIPLHPFLCAIGGFPVCFLKNAEK